MVEGIGGITTLMSAAKKAEIIIACRALSKALIACTDEFKRITNEVQYTDVLAPESAGGLTQADFVGWYDDIGRADIESFLSILGELLDPLTEAQLRVFYNVKAPSGVTLTPPTPIA